jgi:hypothetical protein
MEKKWRENSRLFMELNTKEVSCQDCRRTRLSGLKSELLWELHYSNKLLLLFPGIFPSNELP